MSGGGSVVVRRQLGSKLRALRLAAGKEVIDVTEAGLGSKAKISRIETGKGPVRVADIRALCWLYGADQETTEALVALSPGTREEDWWEKGPGLVVPERLRLYAGLEATASRIRCFEPVFVHGLLQTEAYARAIIGVDPRRPAEVVEQRVRFRMERQRTQADVTVIMSEAALRMVAGSPTVLSEQIEHLGEVADRDVRVLPFSAGAYPERGTFALLDFDDDDDPPVAYSEAPGVSRYFDKPHDRADYEYVWQFLMERSIPFREW